MSRPFPQEEGLMAIRRRATATPALPPGITKADITPHNVAWVAGSGGTLTFYNTAGFGWCLATLAIAAGRRGQPDRTYAVKLDDGAVVRIGGGPHVLSTVTVYINKGRETALKRYIDLYTEGAGRAGQIRDRISSRRAQGQEMRAAGRRSWQWDV